MSRGQLNFTSFALACGLALPSCARETAIGPGGDQGTLVIRADVTGTAVATVVVDVTAPDIATALVFNIPISNGVAEDTITVPTGSNRTITMRAFDAGGVETQAGSVTLDIAPGTSPTISVVLTPLTDDLPITVTLGRFIVTVTPSRDTLAIGATVQLTASIKDSNGNPTDGAVRWATDHPGVARVDDSGLVTAVAPGNTKIVGTFRGAAGTATVSVTR